MNIVIILGILLAVGLLAALVVDLRDRKRKSKNVGIPSKTEIRDDMWDKHGNDITPNTIGNGGVAGGM